MPQNDTVAEDITELAWEDLVMETDDNPDIPTYTNSGSTADTINESTTECQTGNTIA